MDKPEEVLMKLDDPTKAANKMEELFYRGLRITISIVGTIPTFVFILLAPGIDKQLRGIDSDLHIPPKNNSQ